MAENEQEVKVTCDICGEYEGTERQVRSGHKPRCKEKRAKEAALVAQAEPDDGVEPLEAAPEPVSLPIKEDAPPELVTVVESAATRERETPDRKKRVPLGVRREKLSAPTRPGFHRRWMNDDWNKDPNRIAAAEAGGYALVEGIAPRVVGSNDKGDPITARLMEIPQELYDEDQAEKARQIDEKEKEMGKGTFYSTPGDKQYVPDGAANRD